MPTQGRTVVLNQPLADLSHAYLAMWTALDIYDPDRDRWSEPADFGDEQARRERANAALEKVETHDAAPTLRDDVRRFRRALRELESGAKFTESKQKLCHELAQRGNQLGHDSVSYAQHQSQGA